MHLLGREIAGTVADACALADAMLARHADELATAWHELALSAKVLGEALASNATLALSHASVFLDAFGHTVIAWMWLRQAVVAQPHADSPEAAFYRGKLAAAHYFFRYELPRTGPQHVLLRSLEPLLVELDDACF